MVGSRSLSLLASLNHALGFLRVARTALVNTSQLEDNLDRFRRVEV